jgi:hypothetical protein
MTLSPTDHGNTMTDTFLERAFTDRGAPSRTTREAEGVVRAAREKARVIIERMNESIHQKTQAEAHQK